MRLRLHTAAFFFANLVLSSSLSAGEVPSLRCGFYPLDTTNELKANVRLIRSFFGLGRQIVEIDPERDGTWTEVVTIDSNENEVSYRDGWSVKNSKTCDSSKYNALDHCPTFKIVDKKILRVPSSGLEVVKTKQWFQTDCCHNKTPFNAGDLMSEGACVVIRALE